MADDPYRIEGPALISFSGGRTSGYMLGQIVRAWGGSLPANVYVAFANTGKEDPATLRFVHDCATHFGVQVRWLEFVTDLRSVGAAGRFEEVGFNSASRAGEPLDRLIARKQGLFSTITGRWCTQFCKVGVLHDFMETQGYGRGEFTEVIGFRADERDRVFELPLKASNIDRRFAFPLSKAGVRKPDVNAWWHAMPFDLGLPPGYGNCDNCPFLARKARIARARRAPEKLNWWATHETARSFAFGRESIADLIREIEANPLLPLTGIEEDAADSDCVGWCGGEAE